MEAAAGGNIPITAGMSTPAGPGKNHTIKIYM